MPGLSNVSPLNNEAQAAEARHAQAGEAVQADATGDVQGEDLAPIAIIG